MRSGISISLSPPDRDRLDRIIKDRNAAQKHAWRAEIVLLTSDGVGTNEIMRRTGTSKTCVWRWQERFMQEGVEGLLRDKTRPSRIQPLAPRVTERIVARTLEDPPGETTHWTALMMATEVGISVSSVQRIWRAHGLQPRRVRQFKLSNDPKFARSYAMSSGYTFRRLLTRSCCRSTKRARSRRWIARNPACRSRRDGPEP
jgi:transposase